jgi:perosamine synthetase
MKVGVNEIKLEKEDIAEVSKALNDGWYSSTGPYVEKFETDWSTYCSRKYAVAVSNGTMALVAAVRALKLEPGDEIIIPNFTIISCALAVLEAGCTPILIDCEPDTLNIDTELIEEAITPRTKAIMVVHIYGHPSDMQEILRIAKKYDLVVIEDAAEAHGASYNLDRSNPKSWTRCGSLTEMSTFSFFANKLITSGEGGMVLTDNYESFSNLVAIRNLGFSKERSYLHRQEGLQLRLSSMQAALAIRQIPRMPEILMKKKRILEYYQSGLNGLESVSLLKQKDWAQSSNWVVPIKVNPKRKTVVVLREELLKQGIETRPLFHGMHAQPIYSKFEFTQKRRFPVSEEATNIGLILPSGLGTTEDQLEYVVSKLRLLIQ